MPLCAEGSDPCSIGRRGWVFLFYVFSRSDHMLSDCGLRVNALDRTLSAEAVRDIGQGLH
jgi:hypothetical protein